MSWLKLQSKFFLYNASLSRENIRNDLKDHLDSDDYNFYKYNQVLSQLQFLGFFLEKVFVDFSKYLVIHSNKLIKSDCDIYVKILLFTNSSIR